MIATVRSRSTLVQKHRAGTARSFVLALARRLDWGTLVIEDEHGTQHACGRGAPVVHVRVLDPRAWSRVARHGSVGLADAYLRSWWESDDLTGLVRILLRGVEPAMRVIDRVGRAEARITDPFRRLRSPGRTRDRRNVRAHYDLSNEFFALMLDETMTYSCALFEDASVSLAQAQRSKLDRLCHLLDLQPHDHLVEIGTGWGGFAIHAASNYGCRVTTTTISSAQFDLARRRVAAAGLEDLVTVRPDDYRDLRGSFTKLASIEMIEAVDWRDHDAFFATCSRLLEPNGLMALQAIVIDDNAFDRSKHDEDFIKRFVFPGGCLPSVESIVRSATRRDLRVIELRDIGANYPETLGRWRANVDEHRDAVRALALGPTFSRLWMLYLCYCEAAFLERRVSDVQVVLAKPAWRPAA